MPSHSMNCKADSSVAAFAARFREVGVLAFLICVTLAAAAIAPRMLLPANLRSILLDIPLVMVVAMGMTLVIMTRNIDLSVGSTLGLCGIVVGMVFRSVPGFPIPFALLLGTALGAMLGATNGLLVTRLRVPAIIATLGTLSLYRGLVFLVSGGRQVDPNELPQALIQLSQTSPILLPWIVLIAFAVALATHLFLRCRRTGRAIYAIGGNPEAARLRGIPVDRIVFLTFAITGALAGLAGVLYASRNGFVNPGQTGVSFELNVIAATVIGGTDVFGGSGSAAGTVLGCVLLGVINNALMMTGLSGQWQLAAYGAIILIAVFVDAVLHGRIAGQG